MSFAEQGATADGPRGRAPAGSPRDTQAVGAGPISRGSERVALPARTVRNDRREDPVTIGTLRIEFMVAGASSLKEKRRVVKGLKDRIRHRFNVSVAEVDFQELWRRSALGVAAVGTDGAFVTEVLDEVLALVRHDRSVQVLRQDMETL